MIKIKISYFYQIRNFPIDHIPLSTACGDPAWYHNFKDKMYQFKDKRGVWNGLRAEIFNPSAIFPQDGGCRKNCSLSPDNCDFLQLYKIYLQTLNFQEIYEKFKKLNTQLKKAENTNKDFTFVLIVHEAPLNRCSERGPLIEWFAENNYQLEEFRP